MSADTMSSTEFNILLSLFIVWIIYCVDKAKKQK